MVTLRASRAPLVFRCPGALRPATVPVDEVHEAATLGTAAHTLLADLAQTGEVDYSAVPVVAQRYGVDPDELRMLAAMGRKLWTEVAESFPAALTEVPLSAEIAGLLLTGHADLISIAQTTGRVGDWKTGRKDSDYQEQLCAYAALILLDNPELTECTATILWVREHEIENYTMTRAGMREWVGRLEAEIVHWDGTYHPGSHCQYCPRSHECGAANALARRDVAAMTDEEIGRDLATLPPEQIVELHGKAKSVAAIAKRVTDAIKAHVQQHGDVQANGSRLTIETRGKRQLRPAEAWPVLTAAGFNDADFAASMTLSVTKVEKRVAQQAGRGKGAAAVRALGDELKAAGAISTKETHSLALKRA